VDRRSFIRKSVAAAVIVVAIPVFPTPVLPGLVNDLAFWEMTGNGSVGLAADAHLLTLPRLEKSLIEHIVKSAPMIFDRVPIK